MAEFPETILWERFETWIPAPGKSSSGLMPGEESSSDTITIPAWSTASRNMQCPIWNRETMWPCAGNRIGTGGITPITSRCAKALRTAADIAGREVVLNGSRERCPPSIAAEGHLRYATATVEEFWSHFPITHLARTEIISTAYSRAIQFGSRRPTSTKTASTAMPYSEIAL